ncbi:hypothetical protein GCM10020221_03200 [Streptomyces thioluteus]|uniref:Glycosyltransferase n=1 Tax=Streptomyces thioluteus TaxID=66431 RepID=A0ABN3WCU6_STRTU
MPTLSWAGRRRPHQGTRHPHPRLRPGPRGDTAGAPAALRRHPRGGEGYRTACENLAAELGAADAVTFEGRVEDIRDAYAAGNVVMLSSISEGFPFTLIEAMSLRPRHRLHRRRRAVSEAVGDTGLARTARDRGAWPTPP